MPTLEALRNRIDTAEDMQSVVAAMKVLAVVSIRQFEQSLASLDEKGRVVELGLQAAILNRPAGVDLPRIEPGPRVCALIFGSEQGLSGQFNEQIVDFALARLGELTTDPAHRVVLAMGEHVDYRLKSAGIEARRRFPLPGSMARARQAVSGVFTYLGELRRRREIDQIVLFYHKPRTGASYRPFALRLFPPNPAWLLELSTRRWPSKSLPVVRADWRTLFSSLVRDYLFVSVQRAFAESLLSENASRLLAMQVAERDIGDYLDDLTRQFNNQRQSQITSELLDIVAGSEALYGGMEAEDYGMDYL